MGAFKTAIVVWGLLKTRSGKILRGTMKKIADEDSLVDARDDTEDPNALDDNKQALEARGG